MKKVRRRVVERDGQEPNEDQNDNQTNHLQAFEAYRAQKSTNVAQDQQQKGQERMPQKSTHGKRTQILTQESEYHKNTSEISSNLRHQTKEQTLISPVSQIKSAKEASQLHSNNQVETSKQTELKGDQDYKKNRIQMLKHKYLKKAPEIKIQMSKPVQEVAPKLIQNVQPIPKQNQSRIPQKPESYVPLILKQEPKAAEESVKAPKIQDVRKQVEQVKQALKRQPQKVQPPQIVNSLPEKNEQKKAFKPPPPPVNRVNANKVKPPPPPVARSYGNQQQEVFVKESNKEQKAKDPVHIPVDNAEKQKETTVKPTFVPPPPPAKNNRAAPKSALVQDILSKKAKKAQQQITVNDETKDKHYEQGHSALPEQQALPPRHVEAQREHKQAYQDNNLQKVQKVQKKHAVTKKIQMSISEEISAWINSPTAALSNIVHNIDDFISSGTDIADRHFHFTSKNVNFNQALGSFINQFVLKNKLGLNESQKSASYSLALQYFDSKEQVISIQLLLVLTKLGEPYLSKHVQQILQNCQQNLASVLTNKHFFISSELQAFSSMILNQRQIDQNEAIFMLLISPNQRLINHLNAKSFHDATYMISLLSCLHLVRKQYPSVINFYLKLINSLLQNIPQDQSLIQAILKHVNELQTNEKSYQLHKQTKIKLINLISGSQRVSSKPQAKLTSPEPAPKQSGDGGLLGYWNKAVDKIKTATTQLAELKQEKPKPAQQEEPEEQIIYDPVLKRYLINGKVPEDESARPVDPTASKLPPPPPPVKNPNRPVPPPLPGKKARVATNRYA